MCYNKKQLYRITNKIYKELKTDPNSIVIQKMKGRQGLYNRDTKEIILDYRQMIISTLVHEFLHKWNPYKCETWILQQEAFVMNGLTTRQIRNLIKAFAAAI